MKNRTLRRWQWAYVATTGETIILGVDDVQRRRAWIAKRVADGKPVGALFKRRVSYAPWRAAS